MSSLFDRRTALLVLGSSAGAVFLSACAPKVKGTERRRPHPLVHRLLPVHRALVPRQVLQAPVRRHHVQRRQARARVST